MPDGEGRAQGPAHNLIIGQEDQGHGAVDVAVVSRYAEGWHVYAEAGWPGVVPILTTYKGQPTDGKFPPPAGYTGKAGVYPTRDQMTAWASRPDLFGNIALRAPDDVIGLDCDAYGDKHGDQTMLNCIEAWGELPPTWRSSSRELDPDEMAGWDSGIFWYRVPAGLHWLSKLPGGDVEVIQHGHRYAVVWPSVHPSVRQYRWWNLDADDSDPDTALPDGTVPRPSDFPDLPAGWVDGLNVAQVDTASAVDLGEAAGWLTEDEPCQAVAKILDAWTGSSRHDTAMSLQVKILRHGEQGHRGTLAAWDTLHSLFVDAVTGDGTRTATAAESEWSDLAAGAPGQIRNRTHPMRRGCCPRVMTVDLTTRTAVMT